MLQLTSYHISPEKNTTTRISTVTPPSKASSVYYITKQVLHPLINTYASKHVNAVSDWSFMVIGFPRDTNIHQCLHSGEKLSQRNYVRAEHRCLSVYHLKCLQQFSQLVGMLLFIIHPIKHYVLN